MSGPLTFVSEESREAAWRPGSDLMLDPSRSWGLSGAPTANLELVGLLDEASEVVDGRENDHGEASETHRRIARLWTAYLDLPEGAIKGHDAAVMLSQLKDARIRENPENRESWVDKAGYSYCGWQCIEAGSAEGGQNGTR